MNPKLTCALVAAILLGTVPASSLAWAGTIVTLAGEAFIEDRTVELGEVATIDDRSAVGGPDLDSIFLARSPAPGVSVTLSKSYIAARIKVAGVEMDSVDLKGPGAVTVVATGVEIPSAKIESMAEAHIREHCPWDPEDMRIYTRGVQGRLIVPKGEVSYQCKTRRREDFLGPVSVDVLIRVDGDVAARARTLCDVYRSVPAVVAKGDVRRSQVIGVGDVEVVRIEMDRNIDDFVATTEDVVGQMARGYINQGKPITHRMVEEKPKVQRGDIVVITARSGNLVATAKGKAEEDGMTGDLIRVRNISSQRTIYGVVAGERCVEIDL